MNVFYYIFNNLGSELMLFVSGISAIAASAIALKYFIGYVRH